MRAQHWRVHLSSRVWAHLPRQVSRQGPGVLSLCPVGAGKGRTDRGIRDRTGPELPRRLQRLANKAVTTEGGPHTRGICRRRVLDSSSPGRTHRAERDESGRRRP